MDSPIGNFIPNSIPWDEVPARPLTLVYPVHTDHGAVADANFLARILRPKVDLSRPTNLLLMSVTDVF